MEVEPPAKLNKCKKITFLINNTYVLITGFLWLVYVTYLVMSENLDEFHLVASVPIGFISILVSFCGIFIYLTNKAIPYYMYSTFLIPLIVWEILSAITLAADHKTSGAVLLALAPIKIVGVIFGFQFAKAIVHQFCLLNRGQLPSQRTFDEKSNN
ncbi:unnamed protein product [Rodentolepis nana]|uniref:Transmembrane protein n=1 Tax=Rodentolepis nana TaxID=102285 RepID=A0A0R3T655_RODNA|nr:unnamed protein product [Rodentolepis nana]